MPENNNKAQGILKNGILAISSPNSVLSSNSYDEEVSSYDEHNRQNINEDTTEYEISINTNTENEINRETDTEVNVEGDNDDDDEDDEGIEKMRQNEEISCNSVISSVTTSLSSPNQNHKRRKSFTVVNNNNSNANATIGVPQTLISCLDELQQGGSLVSWKITGQAENLTVKVTWNNNESLPQQNTNSSSATNNYFENLTYDSTAFGNNKEASLPKHKFIGGSSNSDEYQNYQDIELAINNNEKLKLELKAFRTSFKNCIRGLLIDLTSDTTRRSQSSLEYNNVIQTNEVKLKSILKNAILSLNDLLIEEIDIDEECAFAKLDNKIKLIIINQIEKCIKTKPGKLLKEVDAKIKRDKEKKNQSNSSTSSTDNYEDDLAFLIINKYASKEKFTNLLDILTKHTNDSQSQAATDESENLSETNENINELVEDDDDNHESSLTAKINEDNDEDDDETEEELSDDIITSHQSTLDNMIANENSYHDNFLNKIDISGLNFSSRAGLRLKSYVNELMHREENSDNDTIGIENFLDYMKRREESRIKKSKISTSQSTLNNNNNNNNNNNSNSKEVITNTSHNSKAHIYDQLADSSNQLKLRSNSLLSDSKAGLTRSLPSTENLILSLNSLMQQNLNKENTGNVTDSDFDIASTIVDKTESDWQDNWSFIGKTNHVTSLNDINNIMNKPVMVTVPEPILKNFAKANDEEEEDDEKLSDLSNDNTTEKNNDDTHELTNNDIEQNEIDEAYESTKNSNSNNEMNRSREANLSNANEEAQKFPIPKNIMFNKATSSKSASYYRRERLESDTETDFSPQYISKKLLSSSKSKEDEDNEDPTRIRPKANINDPRFEVRPTDRLIRLGETVKFACKVKGTKPLEVFWFKMNGDELVNNEKYEIYHDDEYHYLKIFNTVQRDSGMYLCVISNDIEQNIDSFYLQLRDNNRYFRSPKFIIEMSDIEIEEGYSATFKVKVDFGYPKARILFYKNDELILNDRRHEIYYCGEGVYNLHIPTVTEEHNLQYSCVAINNGGRVVSNAELYVLEKEEIRRPDIPNSKFNSLKARHGHQSNLADVNSLNNIYSSAKTLNSDETEKMSESNVYLTTTGSVSTASYDLWLDTYEPNLKNNSNKLIEKSFIQDYMLLKSSPNAMNNNVNVETNEQLSYGIRRFLYPEESLDCKLTSSNYSEKFNLNDEREINTLEEFTNDSTINLREKLMQIEIDPEQENEEIISRNKRGRKNKLVVSTSESAISALKRQESSKNKPSNKSHQLTNSSPLINVKSSTNIHATKHNSRKSNLLDKSQAELNDISSGKASKMASPIRRDEHNVNLIVDASSDDINNLFDRISSSDLENYKTSTIKKSQSSDRIKELPQQQQTQGRQSIDNKQIDQKYSEPVLINKTNHRKLLDSVMAELNERYKEAEAKSKSKDTILSIQNEYKEFKIEPVKQLKKLWESQVGNILTVPKKIQISVGNESGSNEMKEMDSKKAKKWQSMQSINTNNNSNTSTEGDGVKTKLQPQLSSPPIQTKRPASPVSIKNNYLKHVSSSNDNLNKISNQNSHHQTRQSSVSSKGSIKSMNNSKMQANMNNVFDQIKKRDHLLRSISVDGSVFEEDVRKQSTNENIEKATKSNSVSSNSNSSHSANIKSSNDDKYDYDEYIKSECDSTHMVKKLKEKFDNKDAAFIKVASLTCRSVLAREDGPHKTNGSAGNLGVKANNSNRPMLSLLEQSPVSAQIHQQQQQQKREFLKKSESVSNLASSISSPLSSKHLSYSTDISSAATSIKSSDSKYQMHAKDEEYNNDGVIKHEPLRKFRSTSSQSVSTPYTSFTSASSSSASQQTTIAKENRNELKNQNSFSKEIKKLLIDIAENRTKTLCKVYDSEDSSLGSEQVRTNGCLINKRPIRTIDNIKSKTEMIKASPADYKSIINLNYLNSSKKQSNVITKVKLWDQLLESGQYNVDKWDKEFC